MIYKKRKNNPEIEIIVLTWNELEVTKKFLKKLYNNTLIDFGLVLIDNGSKDGTSGFLKEFIKDKDNITLVLNEDNMGCVNGRNYGWEIASNLHSKAKYILLIDNDQYVGKGWLKQHTGFMAEGYDVIGVEAWQINSKFMPFHHNTKIEEPFSYVGCGGMLIKSEIIEKIGLFDPNYNPSYFEDPHFCFKLVENGYKIGWNINNKITHMSNSANLDTNTKRINFKRSYRYFKNKWRNKKIPYIMQKE